MTVEGGDVSKVVVVTDSVATLPGEVLRDLDIRVVPIMLNYGGTSYRDGIDLTPEQFYVLQKTAAEMPTTSTPSVGEIAALYEEAARDASGVVAVHVAARLTSVFDAAVIAAQSVAHSEVLVVDSGSAAMAEGFVVLEAARAARAGLDPAAVARKAQETAEKVGLYAMLDTLEFLRRGGRIGTAAWLMGSALQFKPIIQVTEGRVEPMARPRTRQKAIETLLDLLEKRRAGRPLHAAVLHAADPEGADELRDLIEARFDCVELLITEFTPVMGAHTGPGVLGVAFYVE